MNRRELLKASLALPFAGVLGAEAMPEETELYGKSPLLEDLTSIWPARHSIRTDFRRLKLIG